MRSLYWVRLDLRLTDNSALQSFSTNSDLGLICWFPNSTYLRAGEFRKNFIDQSLIQFNSDLEKMDQCLVRFENSILNEFEDIISECQIQKIFFTKGYSFEEQTEENFVINFCKQRKILFESFDQATLINIKNLPFKINDMPNVFTNFRKAVESKLIIHEPCQKPEKLPPQIVHQKSVFSNNERTIFFGGEEQARNRIEDYIWKSDSAKTYKETRNGMIETNDSTKFSPWLSAGCLSARTIYSEVKKYEIQNGANESTYWIFFELLWRDYFKFFAVKHNKQIFKIEGIQNKPVCQPIENKNKFIKWCEGQTPDRFINANMIELKNTGWMSNRGRQNVASFLIHQLNLPWVWGARYFEKMLIDYDCESNWGNWLYLSGQGSDPRSRVFDTKKQSAMYDPNGEYQQLWLR